VTLPEGTDDSQIGAEFENGVVEIVVRDAVTGSEATRIPLRDRSGTPTRRSLG
jgi:HSP20 family protein